MSLLPVNPSLPSADSMEMLLHYAELRRDASRSLAEGLRKKDARKIREAMVLEKQSRELARTTMKSPEKQK